MTMFGFCTHESPVPQQLSTPGVQLCPSCLHGVGVGVGVGVAAGWHTYIAATAICELSLHVSVVSQHRSVFGEQTSPVFLHVPFPGVHKLFTHLPWQQPLSFMQRCPVWLHPCGISRQVPCQQREPSQQLLWKLFGFTSDW